MLPADQPNTTDLSALNSVLDTLPESELKSAGLIVALLAQLNDLNNEFAAAGALKDHCMELRRLEPHGDPLIYAKTLLMLDLWEQMAHRDAVLCVYHVSEALKGIKGYSGIATSLNSNASALRQASKRLEHEFPNHKEMRDSIVHRMEPLASLEQFKKHSVGGQEFHFQSVDDSALSVTVRGSRRLLELSNGKVKNLAAIVALIYSAFPTLNRALPAIPGHDKTSPA